MTRKTIQSIREQIQLARLSTVRVGEDPANLDHLLRLSDEDLAQAITLEDMVDMWSTVPAYFRKGNAAA